MMNIIIRALSQVRNGDYDSPTSQDETPDEKNTKNKMKKEAKK